MNRKAKLEKALTFDEPEVNWSKGFRNGMEHEKKRLAPIHEGMLHAIECLEWFHDCYPGLVKQRAKEALSKIDVVLTDLEEK